MRRRLERIADRHAEVERLLADPEVLARAGRFRELSVEFARLEPVARAFAAAVGIARRAARRRPRARRRSGCRQCARLATQEIATSRARLAADERELQQLLVPADPLDDRNVFLEIRAAAGGDEAAIFAGDLFRMYSRYAERRGWAVEILAESRGEHGGYREVISRVAGRGVYARLKFESGTHRVQRVPATEAQGRIHTSTCTVAILPELEEVESVEINPAELRIDTYRSSGAGGQHVNKTDSAVRITHLPTGHRRRVPGRALAAQEPRARDGAAARAPARGRARARDAAEQARKRRLQVGTGDRSERIRTYNFPQGRLTDHRIELTLYRLEAIVDGDLDEVHRRAAARTPGRGTGPHSNDQRRRRARGAAAGGSKRPRPAPGSTPECCSRRCSVAAAPALDRGSGRAARARPRSRRSPHWPRAALAGEPVAYLTGRREFWSLELEVTPDVLVPRPRRSSSSNSRSRRWRGAAAPAVLDLGTGSGAIALALASERPDAAVDGDRREPRGARRRAAQRGAARPRRICVPRRAPGTNRSARRDSTHRRQSALCRRRRSGARRARARAARARSPRARTGSRRCGSSARVRRRVSPPGGRLIVEHGAAQGAGGARADGRAPACGHRDPPRPRRP